MKHIMIIAVMLLSTLSTCARTRTHVTESATVVADTIYYAADKTTVNSADQAAYYRLILTKGTGMQKQDLFADYFMDGTMKAEGGYSFIDLGNDKNTVLDGQVTTYYVNGKEKLHGKYVNGKREGYFTLQMRNGNIAVVQYKNGESKFDYFIVTTPTGEQQKRPLSEIRSLLQ